MRTASRLILALPAAAVALDAYLVHAPRYLAFVLVFACLLVLARRGWDWCRRLPACPATSAIRSAAAAVLAGAPFFLLLAVAGLAK